MAWAIVVAIHVIRVGAGMALQRYPGPLAITAVQVDLNRGDIPELCALPGIGPGRAAQIILHRVRHGPFRAVGELIQVEGIGPGTLARLAPYAVVGSSGSAR